MSVGFVFKVRMLPICIAIPLAAVVCSIRVLLYSFGLVKSKYLLGPLLLQSNAKTDGDGADQQDLTVFVSHLFSSLFDALEIALSRKENNNIALSV